MIVTARWTPTLKLLGIGLLSLFSFVGLFIGLFLACVMWFPPQWAVRLLPVASMDTFRILYASSYSIFIPMLVGFSGFSLGVSVWAEKKAHATSKQVGSMVALALVGAFLVFSAIIPATLALGATQTNQTTELTQPTLTTQYNQFDQPCTYYIFTDGTYYYAQNCISGLIAYGGPNNAGSTEGTNATAVIDAPISLGISTSGLSIWVAGGTFDLGAHGIRFPGNLSEGFEFNSEPSTTFIYSGSGDAVNIAGQIYVQLGFGRIKGADAGNGIHIEPAPASPTFEYNTVTWFYIAGFVTGLNLDLGTGVYGIDNNVLTGTDIFSVQPGGAPFLTDFQGIAVNGDGQAGQTMYNNFITVSLIAPAGNTTDWNGHTFRGVLDGNPNLAAITYPQYNLWKLGVSGAKPGPRQILIDCFGLFEQFQADLVVIENGTGIQIEAAAKEDVFWVGYMEAPTLAAAINNLSTNYNRVHLENSVLLGWQIPTPPVPAPYTQLTNPFPFPVEIYLNGTGGGISAVYITDPLGDGVRLPGTFSPGDHWTLEPGDQILLIYTGTPTWKWYGDIG